MLGELKLSVLDREGSRIVCVDDLELFEISTNIPHAENYPINKFYIALCRTGNSAGSQSFALKFRGERENSLGFCFPISAFCNADAFSVPWSAVYGNAAFRFLTQATILRRVLSNDNLNALRNKAVSVDDVYDNELSVVVLGKKQLNTFQISESQIPLMLAREGICVTDEEISGSYPPIFRAWQSSVSVARTSEEFKGEEEIFWRLILMAARSGWETGSFLILYQFLEYSIQRVFDWGMVNISPQGISTWDLKVRLSKITNEKFRLNILNERCFDGRFNAQIPEKLRVECQFVLSALGDNIVDHTSWTNALYALRNLVIHNQIRLMKRPELSLSEVNVALTQLCLEIICTLSAPSENGIWANEWSKNELAS